MSKIKNINHNKKNDSGARGKRPLVITVFVSIILMLVACAISLYFYVHTRENLQANIFETNNIKYNQYYALICENTEFNRQIYEYAKAKGEENGILVDMFSQRIGLDYTIEDLFAIAIESKVDGIIVESDDSKEMKNLIDKACNKGIDVVTFLGDSPDSMRRSSIQVSAYNLGKKYGQIVVSEHMSGKEVILVINDSSNSEATQNLIVLGIQDSITRIFGKDSAIQVISYSVDGTDTFVMEEVIRSAFIDGEISPDIIICPDDQATEIAYQAIVDYNRVGSIRLIGYHNSQTILEGIRQGVIEATIAVDVKEIGDYSVEALREYKSAGFTSEYYSVDSTIIDKNNILNY